MLRNFSLAVRRTLGVDGGSAADEQLADPKAPEVRTRLKIFVRTKA
jgi:hypothetical protein